VGNANHHCYVSVVKQQLLKTCRGLYSIGNQQTWTGSPGHSMG